MHSVTECKVHDIQDILYQDNTDLLTTNQKEKVRCVFGLGVGEDKFQLPIFEAFLCARRGVGGLVCVCVCLPNSSYGLCGRKATLIECVSQSVC